MISTLPADHGTMVRHHHHRPRRHYPGHGGPVRVLTVPIAMLLVGAAGSVLFSGERSLDGVAAGLTGPGCAIKGNISIDSGERIYHVPGQKFYTETRISSEWGGRWFCSEAEARKAGWRKSRLCCHPDRPGSAIGALVTRGEFRLHASRTCPVSGRSRSRCRPGWAPVWERAFQAGDSPDRPAEAVD